MSGDEVYPDSSRRHLHEGDRKQSVLNFEFETLIERFEDQLGLSPTEAKIRFRDMLQFLYLCGTLKDRPLSPPPAIDEAWHEFVLHTKDYAKFCRQYFGTFIHHVPRTRKSKLIQGKSSNLDFTVKAAREVFGKLSSNWTVAAASCGKCNNCEGDCTPLYD